MSEPTNPVGPIAPGFTREVKAYPSHDHRDSPGGRQGAHGVDLVLILRGDLGAIVARIHTGWMARPLVGFYVPGRAQQREESPGPDQSTRDVYPIAGYVSAHSHEPRRGYVPDGPCDWLQSAACWHEGSYLAGGPVLDVLVAGGSDAAFVYLAGLYESWLVRRPTARGATAAAADGGVGQ